MNIFRVRKLLGRGDLYIIDRNLVVNKKGILMFRFNKNIMIIKAPRTYAFLAITHKKETLHLIRL